MGKKIIKQVSLTLLACIAIGLFLIIVFYNYIPTNKSIPSQVQRYSTPESIAKEIESSIAGIDENDVYQITSADLAKYKTSSDFQTGKADPFDSTDSNSNVTTTNATSAAVVGNNNQLQSQPQTTTTTTTTTNQNSGSNVQRTNTVGANVVTNRNNTTTVTKNTTTSSTTDNYYKASGISKGGK